MLARVAGALYWIGRYLERAENVSRLLLVTSELSVELEGVDDRVARIEWEELLTIVGSGSAQVPAEPRAVTLSHLRWLLLDDQNPTSVRQSLGRARENARSVREVLTREVFWNLNEAFRDVEALSRRRVRDLATGHEIVSRTHQALLTTLGAVEHTLSRDEGWHFHKLGEAIERTHRVLRVLHVKLPSLRRQPADVDLPLFYARWRALLRLVASLENYRRIHGGSLVPERVVRFLLLEPTAPRSVRCGLARVQHYLQALKIEPGLSPAERIVGRQLAGLLYDDEAVLASAEKADFWEDRLRRLGDAHVAIARQYFPV